jgi:hypothetical protein
MESSKILSFEEFINQNNEMPSADSDQFTGDEITGGELTPVPAEEPQPDSEKDTNLSVNMMSTEEPTETGNEPTIEIEPTEEPVSK